MANRHRIIAIIGGAALVAALGACGKREDLKPVAGQPAPVVPSGANRAPTPTEQMTPSAQVRPARSDELLKRSEQRPPDDFDLPPPG